MPIKYVPFIPEPVEGQAVLGNFNRILRYKGADDVSMTLQRGMPLYEMEKQETVGENSDGNMVIRGECVSACAYLKEQGIQVDLVYIDPPFASGADYAKKVYIRRNPKVAEVIAQAEQELDVDELKAFEEKMYGDVWDKEKYLNWMYENLMAIKSVMSENASIYVHIDCKIYDNRTNWKNGGRYLWNDCVKLFDTKLTEPCGSSILSLVQDFNIDYDVTVSGEKFIDIVIDHLDERDFLLDYAKKLEKAYLKVNPKRTQNLIVQEILLRQDIISNIENYLCLVRSAETLVNDSKKSAVDICTNTLAYAMATEKEKELLIKVFQKIEENIQQYSVEKLSRYSNAMSGIGLSSLIEEWIVQNELTEKIYTETELLYVITELYLQICGDFRYQEHIQSICKKWIDGQTPMEINNKETIGIAEVESLCNKRISYEMNFLIGNICDLIEVDGENEEQVDQRNILTLLQKKVKYGVPNMTAISICESVFNDRLLAIELAQILSDANIGTDKILNMLKAHSEEIFSCLDSYPEYFKDRLSVLMK